MGPYSSDSVTLCLYTPSKKLAWYLSRDWGLVDEQPLYPSVPHKGELGSPRHSFVYIPLGTCSPERCPQNQKVECVLFWTSYLYA